MPTVRQCEVPPEVWAKLQAAAGFAPTTYAVLHRPGRSGKWVELGRAPTLLKALAFVEGKGGFWLHEIREEAALFTNPPQLSGSGENARKGLPIASDAISVV